MNQTKDIELDDILQDPVRYGLPTFEQYKANPDKWKPGGNILEAADNSAAGQIRKLIRKQRYEFEGYEAKSLEIVERMARDEGLSLQDLEMYPQIVPEGDKCDIVISFRRKNVLSSGIITGL